MNTFIKKSIQLLVTVMVGLTITACPSKDDNGGGGGGGQVAAIPPYGVPGCPGCPPGTGQNLALGFAMHSPNTIALGLNFTASGAGAAPVTPGYYNGPAVASGEFFVLGAASYTCPMPVGLYVITGLQAGQWQGNSYGGFRMNAVGPANIVLNMYRGGVYQAIPEINFQGRRYPYGMWTELIVESVNGMPCPQIPYFLTGGF